MIYADAVAGYTLLPRVNLEQGFASLGNLRERRGNTNCQNCGTDGHLKTWVRSFGKHQKLDGQERLNLDTKIYGVQFGHDFWVKQTDTNGINVLGSYLSYSRADTDFSDKYHARNGIIISDKKTGKAKSDSISLGLTNTYYSGNGTYLDLVGQLSYLRNKYTARTGYNPDSQNGWSMAMSAEAGHSFALGNTSWSLEPQLQLIYQYQNLDTINDGIRDIDQNTQDALRGRVGMRLSYEAANKSGQSTNIYTLANIWHDFNSPSHTNIGYASYSEKTNETWGEFGIGLQLPIGRASQIYGDVRYEHNFGHNKRHSYSGNIGLKVQW